MTRRTLHIVTKPPKLQRAHGTSVQYVAYAPVENHLRFARQHNRNLGELEKLRPRYTWCQIAGGLAAGGILLLVIGMLVI